MAAAGRPAVPTKVVDRALREAARREGIARADLSVAYLGDAEIAALHERHLGRAGPTDVLAFALHDDGEDPVGDIYVGHDQALRQAAEADAEPGEEMVRLAVHGVLHVLGHDHPTGSERAECRMFRAQEEIVRWACSAASAIASTTGSAS